MGWSEGASGGYSWESLARDLVDLLDAIGVNRFRLVGHDWGLVLGYRTCFNWPDRVEQFVGLGGVHLWSGDGAPPRLWLAPWHVYLIALLGDTASRRMGITARCLRAWRHNGAFTPAETETYMGVMRERRCEMATREFDRNFVAHELPYFALNYRNLRLRVPTLLVNGDHDPLTQGMPPTYRKYADDMQLEIVPDCGHFVAEERPAWLVNRLQRFLG